MTVPAPLPPDEDARLAALHALDVLDTPPDPTLDDLVRVASQICGTPIALVSLVDAERQWFKASAGLDAEETPRDVAFCAHAILEDDIFEVPDATRDARFAANPLVTGEPGVRFYAGAPLTTATGQRIGTLCVIDRAPGRLDAGQQETLRTLARAVIAHLELRRRLDEERRLADELAAAQDAVARQARLLQALSDVQVAYLGDRDVAGAMSSVLDHALAVTGATYGLVAETVAEPDRPVFLRTLGIASTAWDQATRSLLAGHATGLELPELDSLPGAVARTNRPHVVDDAASLARVGALPPGCPPLERFLGVPFAAGAEGGGVLMVANGPGPFDDALVQQLQPLAQICGSLLRSHRREARLEETTSWLGALITNLGAGVLVEDQRRIVRVANDDFCVMFGIPAPPEALKGLDCAAMADDNAAMFVDPAAALERIAELLDRRELVLGEEVALADGRILERDYVPIFVAGEYDGHLWQYRDVTPRKRDERALRDANAELERSARLKDDFLASMSHELRTPLNAILGFSEALRGGVFGDVASDQDEPLAAIEDSGRHLLQLINDILDVSKIRAERLELAPEEVDPAQICHASVRLVREQAKRKGLAIDVVVADDVDHVLADPLRLKQVLVNLLSNAVKFTPAGGAVGIDVARGERGCIRFAVWDTGVGIARRDRQKLFMPFVQLDSGLARSQGGTGLGLVLVKQLVELHGGSVELLSEVGRGSRFTVSLPSAHREAPDAPAEPGAAGAGGATAEAAGDDGAPRVLVVEDNDANVLLAQRTLERAGYRVSVAGNGAEALEAMRREVPDVVMMDVQMPVMDGLEATRRMRADPALAHLPVIAVTAHAMSGDRDRCLAAGADDYLSKPFSPADLVDRVARLAGLRRSRAS